MRVRTSGNRTDKLGHQNKNRTIEYYTIAQAKFPYETLIYKSIKVTSSKPSAKFNLSSLSKITIWSIDYCISVYCD